MDAHDGVRVVDPIGLAVICLILAPVLLHLLVVVGDALDKSIPCESMAGYNPGGATLAERYPAGTWAGMCEEVKNNENKKRVQLTAFMMLVAWPAAAIVAWIRQRG